MEWKFRLLVVFILGYGVAAAQNVLDFTHEPITEKYNVLELNTEVDYFSDNIQNSLITNLVLGGGIDRNSLNSMLENMDGQNSFGGWTDVGLRYRSLSDSALFKKNRSLFLEFGMECGLNNILFLAKLPRTKSGLWNLGSIQKMLSNRAFIGEQKFFDKELKEEFVYSIEPIISRSTFLKVRKEMERRLKVQDNNKKHFTLFGDYMDCECGQSIGSEVKVGVRKNGIKYDNQNYYCTSKTRKWKYGVTSNCSNVRSMRIELTDDFLLTNIEKIVSDSNLLKERFKTDILSKKNEFDEDLKQQTKKLEEKCKKLIKRQEETYENIIIMETDLLQGRSEKKITEGILKKLKSELETYKEEIIKTELNIDSLAEERVWINWLKQYGDELKTKISDEKNKQDWLKGLIKKIEVISDYGFDRENKEVQLGHKFNITFHLKVVRDKFNWTDKTTNPWQYEVKEGSNKFVTENINLRQGRGKKKLLNQKFDNEVKNKHSSELVSDSGVSLKYYNSECRTLNSFGYSRLD
jgi:hypothetical protein